MPGEFSAYLVATPLVTLMFAFYGRVMPFGALGYVSGALAGFVWSLVAGVLSSWLSQDAAMAALSADAVLFACVIVAGSLVGAECSICSCSGRCCASQEVFSAPIRTRDAARAQSVMLATNRTDAAQGIRRFRLQPFARFHFVMKFVGRERGDRSILIARELIRKRTGFETKPSGEGWPTRAGERPAPWTLPQNLIDETRALADGRIPPTGAGASPLGCADRTGGQLGHT